MRIDQLIWDDYRVEHVALHDVDPEEVWQICQDPLHVARREGRNRYLIFGQTDGGRYLFVVLEQMESASYKPITARDMTEAEKRGFRRLRR